MTAGVLSSAALCQVTVSNETLQKDIILAIVLKLAPVLQVKVIVDEKNKNVLKMSMGNPLDSSVNVTVTQRNAILRGIAGPVLHGAMDQSPYYLLGGYYSTGSSTHGTSHNAAFQLSQIHSWMSIADTIRQQEQQQTNVTTEWLEELNEHLTVSSFLIDSPICSLADLDLVVALFQNEDQSTTTRTTYPAIFRWQQQVLAVLVDYASRTNVTLQSTLLPIPLSVKPPLFFYGTENTDELLASLYKGNTNNTSKGMKPSTKQDQLPPKDPQNQDTNKPDGGKPEKSKKSDKAKGTSDGGKAATKNNSAATGGGGGKDDNVPAEYDISALDIRVGKIIKVWEHPEAEKLFCEEIDIGNGTIRQIASGLRPFYKASDLLDRVVLVLCNLKSRNLVGFPSHGMVLCASNADHTAVEFVVPPPTAQLGERIVFEGYENGKPEPDTKLAKKKIFEKLAPDLRTNEVGQVVWKNAIARTEVSQGIITALNVMPNASVS